MSRRVFDSYHAPQEEISGVTESLDRAGIEWFATEKGRWWVGSAAIWVKNDDDYQRAREAIERFQESWRQSARQEFQRRPIEWRRVPLLIAVVGIVLYLMTFWFWL